MNRTLALSASILLATIVAHSSHAADTKDKSQSRSPLDDCLYFNTVHDWRALDDSHLVVWAPNNHVPYLVTLTMPLTSLHMAKTVMFVDDNHDGRLCGFGGDAVALTERAIPPRATIASLARLDEDGMTKLEEKYKLSLSPRGGKKQVPKEPEAASAQ